MDREAVMRALELAALAYAPVQPDLFGRLVAVIDDVSTGVQCFARQDGGTLSIAFRGTDSKRDWITDLSFLRRPIPYDHAASSVRVHGGFMNAYRAPQVRRRLLSLVTPSVRKVTVCGHSFGAALAVLCAVDLQYNFPDRDYEAILFGCPRVGNRAFQAAYNRRVFKTLRVENGNDIVTKLPPALWGYRHVGIPIPVGVLRQWGLISFAQHHPSAYYAALFPGLRP